MSIDDVSESPILSLIGRIFEMQQQGEEVLGLHIGEPDFDTPKGIREAAARSMNSGRTHYVAAQGSPGLRRAIADRYRTRYGVNVTEQEVVIVPAKFALFATLLATIQAGDEVLLADPTYLLLQPTQLVGGRPVYYPLRSDFSFDPGAFESAITSRSRLAILVSPSNPTGRLLRRRDIDAILEIARRERLTVVSDETYESLVYDGQHIAPASLAAGDPPVVTIGSFSKIYSMTGWRIGFAIAPPAIAARLVKIVEHTLTCVPAFIQDAAEWALTNAGSDERHFREEFRRRRDHLLARLSRVDGLDVVPPEGAFYVFPRYRGKLTSVDFCRRLLEEERLAVVPGIAFGPRGEGHVRISFSSSIERLDDGVERLARFLARYPSESG